MIPKYEFPICSLKTKLNTMIYKFPWTYRTPTAPRCPHMVPPHQGQVQADESAVFWIKLGTFPPG